MCHMSLSDAKCDVVRTTSAGQVESFIIPRFIFVNIVIYKGWCSIEYLYLEETLYN